MKRHPSLVVLLFSLILGGLLAARWSTEEYKSGIDWPEPSIVDPGDSIRPPSDAIVLFDGKNLDAFDGGESWIIENGYAIVQTNSITTKEAFGDCQLHLEYATPAEVSGEGQGRGNSGVYLMGKYELQILDSFENKTYFDGQCAAFYKQRPPIVNASRGPGKWQSYDIIFEAPRFAENGSLVRPAYATVLHNGVLVHNHFALLGGTFFDRPPAYEKHPDRLPLLIQDHGNPIRFRNIWIRESVRDAADSQAIQVLVANADKASAIEPVSAQSQVFAAGCPETCDPSCTAFRNQGPFLRLRRPASANSCQPFTR